MKHTMWHNILGEVDYEGEPQKWTFVWPSGKRVTFRGIVRFQAMKTGCYVLHSESGVVYDIPPGYLYVIEGKE